VSLFLSWRLTWFADRSTRRVWHQCESWIDWVVFSSCSKLQLAWCSDQWQICPWVFWCGLLLMKTCSLIYKSFCVLWTTKTIGALRTTQKILYMIFELYNLKYPSPYRVRSLTHFHLLLKHFKFSNLKPSGTFSDCKIRTSSECWTVTCSTRVTHETSFSKDFISFNGWPSSLNTYFWTPCMNHYSLFNLFFTIFPYKYPSISQTIILHSLLLQFLLQQCVSIVGLSYKKNYFENSGIVWMVIGDGATVKRSAVCLRVRLVCLSVKLTIKISFALEWKQTLPQPLPPPSLSPPSSIFPIHLIAPLV